MELYPFQKNAIDTMLAEPERHFCIAGTGAGKTSIALHWAKAQGKSKVLVVTPASKRDSEDWQKEADEWFGSWRGSLTAFDVISWQGLAKWWQDHRKQIADYAVVFDECHSVKAGISSQRGTAFLKIADHTDCWTGYTATPGDCWMDFYAYFAATDRITGKTAFRSRFCNIQTFKGFPEIVGYRETNTLKQWWKEISLSVDISEMLRQLPPETHKVITFKKPASYDKVLKTRMTEDGEFLDTPMSLCAHLRQLCSKSKLNYVADFVEGLGDRIVIFYNFIKEGEELQQAIEKALPKSKVWRIDGKTHDIPTEQTCGKRDVVLVQWQAGSMGLNLQFIQYWLSVSPNYSWTISTQARGRIKRIGQQKPMWFGYLECEHTIEENIYTCLRNKQDFVESSWCEKNNI